jgi:hypothetical protein
VPQGKGFYGGVKARMALVTGRLTLTSIGSITDCTGGKICPAHAAAFGVKAMVFDSVRALRCVSTSRSKEEYNLRGIDVSQASAKS